MPRFLVLLCFAFLTACVPSIQNTIPVDAPAFHLLERGSGLVQLDPPKIGSSSATFRLNLELRNPNLFTMTVLAIDFDFFINDQRLSQNRYTQRLNFVPSGTAVVPVDVTVLLTETSSVLEDLASLLAGDDVVYRLDAALSLEVEGQRQQLAKRTVLSSTFNQDIQLVPPIIRLDTNTVTLVAASADRAVIELGLEFRNISPYGFIFSAPDVSLNFADVNGVAQTEISQALPAFSSASATLRFSFSPSEFGLVDGPLLAGLELSLDGAFSLEMTGLIRLEFIESQLVSGVLE